MSAPSPSGMTPDPRRDFARPPRRGRTLTLRGVLSLIACLVFALICARIFGGTTSHF